jgi:membrane protease YdiL (CAAX protease family)
MIKGLWLYLFSFVLLVLSAWQANLGWLAPFALAVLLFGSLLLWRAEGKPLQELGFRRIAHWGRFFVIGLLIGGLIPVLVLFILWVGDWAVISIKADASQVILSGVILAVIRAGLIAGSEELVFRGFFFQSMNLRSGFTAAAIGSAALWGLTHLPDMFASGLSISSILIGMGTFLLWGVALVICVRLGGNALWLPFGLHFGYNLVFSVFRYFLESTIVGPEWIIGHPSWRPESGVLGLALWVFGLIILAGPIIRLNRNLNTTQPSGSD